MELERLKGKVIVISGGTKGVGRAFAEVAGREGAKVVIGGGEYTLCMENEQNYIVLDDSNTEVIRIVHKGITGGWKIENGRDFSPEVLCGVFIFCRYIEQENEFLMV